MRRISSLPHLDPTLAPLDIEHLGPVLFADTVGFISRSADDIGRGL